MDSASVKKKSKAKLPTARALEMLRKEGYVSDIVERHNAFAGPPGMKCPVCHKNKVGSKNDFLGFADIVYCTGSSIVALQVTDGTHHSKRVAKILAEPRALAWLQSGGLIEVWSFMKQGLAGKPKRWVCRKQEVVMEDFV